MKQVDRSQMNNIAGGTFKSGGHRHKKPRPPSVVITPPTVKPPAPDGPHIHIEL